MSDRSVYIANTAAFLPNEPVDNANMERLLGQVGERPSRARRTVLRSNGITSRHYGIDPETLEQNYTNAEITAQAVRALDYDLSLLSCLSCGTSIPDQLMPNHAAMVHGELGSPACEIASMSGVCASGMAALKYAFLNVLAGVHSSAVATGSDLPSAVMRAKSYQQEISAMVDELDRKPELAFEKDFLRWMLSDGAGAFLLQSEPAEGQLSLRIDWLDIFSYAGDMETCMYAGAVKNSDGSLTGWSSADESAESLLSVMTVKQDVKLLNENVIHYTVEKPVTELVEKYQLDAGQIDWFLPHYSSEYFRDKVHKGMQVAGLDIPQQRWFSNLTSRGNTGAASMYIMIDELRRSGKLEPGQRLLCYIPESGRFSSAYLHLTVV